MSHAPIVHVACLIYPSHQGTQAAIHSMLHALTKAGHSTHLLTYAHGAYPVDTPFEVHRVPDFPKVRSLRSGPSIGKIALDMRCVLAIRKLVRTLKPEIIVAHHIEAAIAAILARVSPVYYLAHTSLGNELPQYLPILPAPMISRLARMVETRICKQVKATYAVSPALAKHLGSNVGYLPIPWPPSMTEPITMSERKEARQAIRIESWTPVCLYAGNLDAYQGWSTLPEAVRLMRKTHPDTRLLVATESNPMPLYQACAKARIQNALIVRRLNSEHARRQAYAAADLCWIPRKTPGGVPIKMLDAFARGVPVVAMKRALAGLPVRQACIVVRNDHSTDLANGALQLLQSPAQARTMTTKARQYLKEHHSDDKLHTTFETLLLRQHTHTTQARLTHLQRNGYNMRIS